MILITNLPPARKEPDYRRYAISVLKGLANAEPEWDAHGYRLGYELSFFKDGDNAFSEAQALSEGVQNILGKVLPGEKMSKIDPKRDADQYHVEFYVYPPQEFGLGIDAYKQELKDTLHRMEAQINALTGSRESGIHR
ncbi:MAG: hypothetical protein KGJ06_09605 [Pseudomonadota bacterium]|nr:hypothetical protein [Pseudomonadota bacterium]